MSLQVSYGAKPSHNRTTVQVVDPTSQARDSVRGLLNVDEIQLSQFYGHALTIGRDPSNAIRSDHATVSRKHFVVYRSSEGTWRLVPQPNCSNPVLINGIPVGDGIDLQPLQLVKAGGIRWLVIADWIPEQGQPVPIPATAIDELMIFAAIWYGSIHSAAKALGVKSDTLARRFAEWPLYGPWKEHREQWGQLRRRVGLLCGVPEEIVDVPFGTAA